MTEAVKRCAKCGVVKTLDRFHKHKGGPQGRHSWCKPCATVYYRANKKHNYSPEQRRRWQVKTRYGLTDEDVLGLYEVQQGRCGICRKELGASTCIDLRQQRALSQTREKFHAWVCQVLNRGAVLSTDHAFAQFRDDYGDSAAYRAVAKALEA